MAPELDGHVRQPIVNYNHNEFALLSSDDLAAINHHLDEVPKVMAYFGYEYVHSKAEDPRILMRKFRTCIV
ncbi:MAG: hypothetical protein M3R29_05355 [Verrucomicrobiota bacterium]|nr:hypothetical protein [Verrucomicrobiota bacterium]